MATPAPTPMTLAGVGPATGPAEPVPPPADEEVALVGDPVAVDDEAAAHVHLRRR